MVRQFRSDSDLKLFIFFVVGKLHCSVAPPVHTTTVTTTTVLEKVLIERYMLSGL